METAPEFPVLDTMRAVGALAVLTTHTSFQTGEYLGNGLGGTFLARLDVGVAIFFVLSGFLLSRSHFARKKVGLPAASTGRYYEKRALRILPVYWVTVAIALALVPGNEVYGSGQWVSSLLMLDSYRLKALPHGLTHMWSLSVEVAFYVILPLLMLVARGSRRRVGMVLVLMVTTNLLWLGWLAQEVEPHVAGSTGLWLPGYLTWFAGGVALAWMHVELQAGHGGRVVSACAAFLQLPGVCWTTVGGLMLLVATPIAGPIVLLTGTEAESVAKHVVYAAVGVLLVGTGVFADSSGSYARTMSLRPLRHLGRISYSIFCIHLAVLSLTFEVLAIEPFTGNGLLVWAVTVALTLVASELFYFLVEMPALRLKRRVGRADQRASTVSTPLDEATTR